MKGACGKGYCPAAVRMVWGVHEWTLPVAAEAIGRRQTTLLRSAEKLGLDRRPRQRSDTKVSISRLKSLWADESIPLRCIAEMVGKSHDAIQKIAIAMNFPKRKGGPKPFIHIPESFNDMWLYGVSTHAMSKMIGCAQGSISRTAKQRKLPLRYGKRTRGLTIDEYLSIKMAEGLKRFADVECEAAKIMWQGREAA